MEHLANPHRGRGLDHPDLADVPRPSAVSGRTAALLARCPRAAETPLLDAPALAVEAGIAALTVKDERGRMGLGSFKALGAANVIAHDAEAGRARGRTYVTASAGNHGLSVAAGAAAFGARARVFLAETVPESFAARLRAEGAEVVRAGATYEASMAAAEADAGAGGGVLLSDSSWPGYTELPHLLMEGYTVLMAEAVDRMEIPPDHVLLQAGVGGLAAAAAAVVRARWGDAPTVTVVEPEAAPALFRSIAAGAPVTTDGPVSIMGRLDCKTPSLIALKGLARDADHFVTLTEDEARHGTARAAEAGLASTPSGAAGFAALLTPGADALGLGPATRALVILSEAAEA
ncbi:diaminopropionate ammonia-lyase [Oceanicola granulosus HTCC2516]|uniref:Diaminopropionate ammonia-lyase n=1 Tax=Oceanicola granulosus (strain ATCC BAA-861 / DSM 15982 / KCTC 12143 / HTCC2516) TaxID=314256 RepID=Q2CC25_OCEGH|nr:pyridoxal-phosphate dependent enzyme [Oceanicola granulosus]EAR50256.1 diaminopropionate ammonia-lyase [Oceanicola granulosus HTCC2516]